MPQRSVARRCAKGDRMSVQAHNEDQIDKTMIVVITLTALFIIALGSTSEWSHVTGPGPSDVVKIMQTLR